MNLPNKALAEVAMTALHKTIGDQLGTLRTDTQTTLDENGIERLAVKLPDGSKVASIIGTNPEPTANITDPDAFLAWVTEHSPHNVVTRTITEVRPAFITALLDEMAGKQVPEIVNPANGEIITVPGVEMQTRTRSHSVRFEKTGRELISAAWRAGLLDHIEGLRALTPGGAQ